MAKSLYHSSTGNQSEHCIHVVGVGRTGAAYVEALLRTGEIEDLLEDPRARFAAMVVDIGDQDMGIVTDYAGAFRKRLESRGIPQERFLFHPIALQVPSKEDLFNSTNRMREFLKLEYPRYYWNPNYESWVNRNIPLPKAGEHIPRAVAKAIYAKAYYDGDRVLNDALDKFVAHIEQAQIPSMVLVPFSLAGGTGTGIVVDLARHLSNVKLGRRLPVIGVGQLSSSGDPDVHRDTPTMYTALNDLDCMLDDEKNNGVMTVWGDLYKNPFTGGFFVVNPEQSWMRLTAYTETGEQRIRDSFRHMVTNRFVADSFMRFAVDQHGRVLFKALRPAGFTGAPHETLSAKARNWTLFNVAKLTHPGVQVLPGEHGEKWDAVVNQWTDFVPTYDGVKDAFRTDYAEVHVHVPRDMDSDAVCKKMKDMITENYLLEGGDKPVQVFPHEFFDALTAYSVIILPGMAKTDLNAFWSSRDAYDKLSWEEKLNEHSWLIDIGPMISEPAIRFQGLAGECIWGCACWIVVPYDELRGDKLPPATRKEIFANAIAPMTRTVVTTPGGDPKTAETAAVG
ncbi:hypothetical protein BTHE68_40990 [Burkholderia sp. THE68]|uniref:tubulin-like doman-containing protein n=1 Tax=Burkholderia sp. THE68 TaxID=758782 RepID=UPI0013166E83|nr:tubulin-like doman-containing protein [Burkholderia sp. THE68]BBU30365.1 hypothetical protein BTHE68_40990 [Burkholderia sp. THE68]